jgi:hypothetical protein
MADIWHKFQVMLLHFILLVKTKFMDVNIHLKHKQYFSMVGFSHYDQQWRFHFTDKNSNHGWEVSLLCNTLPCILQQCRMRVTQRERESMTDRQKQQMGLIWPCFLHSGCLSSTTITHCSHKPHQQSSFNTLSPASRTLINLYPANMENMVS